MPTDPRWVGYVFYGVGETAKQAGDVGGGGIDVDGAEIDEAGDFVAGEEDVVVPDIAEAGLQREVTLGERFELGDCMWDRAWQCGDELAGEWGEVGPGGVADGAREVVDLSRAISSRSRVRWRMGAGGAPATRSVAVAGGDRLWKSATALWNWARARMAARSFSRDGATFVIGGAGHHGASSHRWPACSTNDWSSRVVIGTGRKSRPRVAAWRRTAWMNRSRSGDGCSRASGGE